MTSLNDMINNYPAVQRQEYTTPYDGLTALAALGIDLDVVLEEIRWWHEAALTHPRGDYDAPSDREQAFDILEELNVVIKTSFAMYEYRKKVETQLRQDSPEYLGTEPPITF